MIGSFRFGSEEEYFVNDNEKRNVARTKVHDFFTRCRRYFPEEIQREMLEPQLEIATSPSTDFAETRHKLSSLRQGIAAVAQETNLSIIASGTHPLAVLSRIKVTNQSRYDKVMHDLQMIGSRNMVCGMHVHVEVPEPDRRVDLMNRIQPYLPLLSALSTSSPFWQAQRTGLLGLSTGSLPGDAPHRIAGILQQRS